MDAEDLVRRYYAGDDLESRVMAALAAAGLDLDHLGVDDLAGLDQLHAGFRQATEYVLDSLALAPGTTLLDVGCGVGGPARVAAALHGCRVTGIDLSADFVDLARSLTERLGLGSQVTFDIGSATELPYADASFARAMLNHVGMNIADKAAVFGEVRRVLEPGGRFAVYEQMFLRAGDGDGDGDGDLIYPLPWAEDASSSFVETRERYVELLTAAGFDVEHDEDRTAANAAGGPPPPGALTPGDLFGPGFGEAMGNNIVAAMTGTLGAVLMVARAR